jgi:hypothetical protein
MQNSDKEHVASIQLERQVMVPDGSLPMLSSLSALAETGVAHISLKQNIQMASVSFLECITILD